MQSDAVFYLGVTFLIGAAVCFHIKPRWTAVLIALGGIPLACVVSDMYPDASIYAFACVIMLASAYHVATRPSKP